MNRRHFLAVSGAATMAAVTSKTLAAENAAGSERDIYELREIHLDVEEKGKPADKGKEQQPHRGEEQRKGLDAFLKEAAIPAMNRLGIKPVGVFYPAEGLSPVYMLLRHPSMESIATLMPRMGEDAEYRSKAATFINAPASAPAYKRIESSLKIAFKGMPHLETPVKDPGRVFQLRIYESPSHRTNLKKIEMFNDAGEIKIFRECGMNPVFFGQTLVGSRLPNLTYMLVFKDAEAQKAGWGKFMNHPDWKKLKEMPEYADKDILSNITNVQLVAAEYSQI